MSKEIIYIENFLPIVFQNYIEDILCGNNFPYNFVDNAAYGLEEVQQKYPDIKPKYTDLNQYAFNHVVFLENEGSSVFFKDLFPIIYFLKDEIKSILRIRVGMSVKVKDQNVIHSPHVDYLIPHKVLLYYVNDSDGDTIFYEKTENDYIEFKRIAPQKGAAVIFDGNIYHSSSTPCKNQRRITINIDYII
jgi:hypothetical protein